MPKHALLLALLSGILWTLPCSQAEAAKGKDVHIEILAVQALTEGPASNSLSGRVAKHVKRLPFTYKRYSLLSSTPYTRAWGDAAVLTSKGGAKISVTPSLKGKTLSIAVKVEGRKQSCRKMQTSYEPHPDSLIPIICDNLIDGGTVLFFVSAKQL